MILLMRIVIPSGGLRYKSTHMLIYTVCIIIICILKLYFVCLFLITYTLRESEVSEAVVFHLNTNFSYAMSILDNISLFDDSKERS
jgi:hypothetical protein